MQHFFVLLSPSGDSCDRVKTRQRHELHAAIAAVRALPLAPRPADRRGVVLPRAGGGAGEDLGGERRRPRPSAAEFIVRAVDAAAADIYRVRHWMADLSCVYIHFYYNPLGHRPL